MRARVTPVMDTFYVVKFAKPSHSVSRKGLNKSASENTWRVCITEIHFNNKNPYEKNSRFALSTFRVISVHILR